MILPRFFSAFAEARTTCSATLELRHEPQQSTLWEGVAYAFFSKHARSSIKELTIGGDMMSLASAERVAAIVCGENPSRFMFGDSTESETSQPLYNGDRYMLRAVIERLDDFDAAEGYLFSKLSAQEEKERAIVKRDRIWTLQTDVVGVRVIDRDEDDESLCWCLYLRMAFAGYHRKVLK